MWRRRGKSAYKDGGIHRRFAATTREGMGLPEAGTGKEGASLNCLGGSRALPEPVLDFLSSEL